MSEPKLSLILPCYNEAEHFQISAQKIYAVLKKSRLVFEIIFVEDNSGDETRRLLQEFIGDAKDSRLKVIYHDQNTGRGKTVCDGIAAAQGKVVGFMDIDCEISPDYIPLFVKKIEANHDIVCARRIYQVSASSVVRALVSKVYSLLVRVLLHTSLSDTEAGFKFFKRDKIMPIVALSSDPGWFWDTEIMILSERAGLRILFLPVLFKRRTDKTSTVHLFKDSWDYFQKLISF